MRRRFVTFEGGEGSGKSTQLARLAARLRAQGLDPLVTREPGGTPVAEGIRTLLLDPALAPGALGEALLMEAARAELVATVIRPALAAGRIVLCDRYADSTLAYQGAGRGLGLAMLREWNRVATGGLTPDLTLLFDLDPEIGLSRRSGASGEPNRLDRESALRLIGRQESVQRGLEEVTTLLADLPSGFHLLVDLGRLESMDTDCVVEIGKVMELFDKKGVGLIVRVIPDPAKDIGLNILSLFHYRREIQIVTCETLTEAKQALAVGI